MLHSNCCIPCSQLCAHSAFASLFTDCSPSFHLSVSSLAVQSGFRQHLSLRLRLGCFSSRKPFKSSRFDAFKVDVLFNRKEPVGSCVLAFDDGLALPGKKICWQLEIKTTEKLCFGCRKNSLLGDKGAKLRLNAITQETQYLNLPIPLIEDEKERHFRCRYRIEGWNRLQKSKYPTPKTKNSELGAMIARKLVVGLQTIEESLAALDSDEHLASTMESHCANYGPLSEKVGSWLVMGLCRNGKPERGLELYGWLNSKGLQVSVGAYNSLVAGCMRLNLHAELMDLFNSMKKLGKQPTLYIYTVVMKVLCQHQGWEATHRIYLEMLDKKVKLDVIAYNTLLAAYGRARKWERAWKIWGKMKLEGCKENMGTYCLLLSTFVRCKNLELVLDVYFCVITKGWKPTYSMYKGLVFICAQEGRWMLALEFLYEFLYSGEVIDSKVWNSLVHLIREARKPSQLFK